jgi:hypothetical protein
VEKKRCKGHKWEPLYKKPGDDAPDDLRYEYVAMCMVSGIQGDHICSECGCLGSVRRGYSRGGVHALKPLYGSRRGDEIDPETGNLEALARWAASHKAKADAWNNKVAQAQAASV